MVKFSESKCEQWLLGSGEGEMGGDQLVGRKAQASDGNGSRELVCNPEEVSSLTMIVMSR